MVGRVLKLVLCILLFDSCTQDKVEKSRFFLEYDYLVPQNGDTAFFATLYAGEKLLKWNEYVDLAKKFADTCSLSGKIRGVGFVNTCDIEYLHSNDAPGYPDGTGIFSVGFFMGDTTNKVEVAFWDNDIDSCFTYEIINGRKVNPDSIKEVIYKKYYK